MKTKANPNRMTAAEYRRRVEKAMSEAEWQADVVKKATTLGWWCYHTHDARRSESGWPDLVLIRDRRIVFAELKSMRGVPSPAQVMVLGMLRVVAEFVNRATCAETIVVRTWRPNDVDDVIATLAAR